MSRGLAGLLPGTGSSIIPLDVCTVDNTSRTIQINAENEVVKNFPSLGASDKMSPEYESQVRSYYGKGASVWEACGVGTSDLGIGTAKEGAHGGLRRANHRHKG